ncbi:hypothetical protein NY588_03260 [Curtobacterium flaccumfaciens pv. beticola]|uniref:hypothetical protein n=1 Tax=Curtobacterium flaccumfaciens TaxID=2035 RepID=UPI00349F5D16|nr:hypothetical protein [Curtobacterium flaccumfaciens pv. basellae]
MAALGNALLAVGVLTAALTATALDRRTAALLGATGGTVGSFLAWLLAPQAWTGSWLLPWIATGAGTVAVVAGWAAARAYTGLTRSPREHEDDTTSITTLPG